jgi:hypothetical protein
MTNLITSGRPAHVLVASAALLFGALTILGDGKQAFGKPPAKSNGNGAVVLHTYETEFGTEVINTIPVGAANLVPLLPGGYQLVPAAALGLGGWDQGIVAIVNFQGTNNTLDGRRSRQRRRTVIDLLILVAEPAAAEMAGLDIPGAFHLYSLAFYTDDVRYAASLRSADMPVEFVPRLMHDRQIDMDGEGTLFVDVPSKNSPFYSLNTAFGHSPAGPLDAVFWYEGKKGTAAIHFQHDTHEEEQAQSLVFTEPGSPLNALLEGGGFGPGPTDPETGYESVTTPSLNILYPQGAFGRLLLIED